MAKAPVPAGVKECVEELVSKNDIVVFSKLWCPNSVRAKKLLDKVLKSKDCYTVYELEDNTQKSCTTVATGQDFQNFFHEVTGARTVPRVYVQGKCIGGADELEKFHAQGKLVEACKAAGVPLA